MGVFFGSNGGSGTNIGGTSFFSGLHGSESMSHIGNSTFSSTGNSMSHIGNTSFTSNGGSISHIGNSYFTSDGKSYTKIGNTLIGSDGTSWSGIGGMSDGDARDIIFHNM